MLIMRTPTAVLIIILLIGGGYAYTYFQVKEASENIFENAEIVDFQLENISLIPPSADLTLYFSVDNPSPYGFTYSAEIEMYIGCNYITTVQADDEFVKANAHSIITMECRIGGLDVSLLQAYVGDPILIYEVHMVVNYKIFGIIPITIIESSFGYST